MTQSLYGRMYLVAYDTDTGALYDRTRAGFLLRVAVLAELAGLGRVVDAAGQVAVADSRPTGDPVLDPVLRRAGAHRRTWKAWVRADRKETLGAVEDRLAELGLVTVRERAAGFARSARREVTVHDAAAVRALQGGLAALLRGDGPAGPDEAVLLALASAGGARHVVPRADARAEAGRIDALTGRLDDIAPSLGRAVRGLGTTLVAAQGGMGGG
ncbi:GPP34 family phosphoprotein [Streptomyces sp. NPDC048416]|uniref:GOLPH3/VPS74 family protein n=1 Tax=Streptomyces sp. NPDC048416 TaxID=3365546 RepID=UPI00371161FB